MKKVSFVVITLFMLSACSPNNNSQQGTDVLRDNRNSTQNIVNNNQGINITRTNTGNITNGNTTAPTGNDSNREERVTQVVNESTRYVGQKMDGDTLVRKVMSHVGFHGFDVRNPYWKVVNYQHDAQPGDILHLDSNGDGEVDEHAILLDNGTIIHSNSDGIVEMINIDNHPDLPNKVIHVQRVIKH